MNIQEFRQKYPQYNDVPDQELANSFYSKYYSDMDKNKFMSDFLGGEDKNAGFIGGVKESISNIPSSAYNTVKSMIKGIVEVPSMLHFGNPSTTRKPTTIPEELYGNMAKALMNRYGSLDAVENTLRKDPVGALMDVGLSLSGTGALAKGAGLTKVGGALSKTAGFVDPFSLAGKGISAGIGKLKLPERIAQSAVKMRTTLPLAQREAATTELLNQPVFKTMPGRHTLAKKGIQNIEKTIGSAIEQADVQGLTGKTSDVLGDLERMKQLPTYSQGPLRRENIGAIEGVKQRFLESPGPLAQQYPYNLSGPVKEYPLSLAQSMKKATYDDILRAQANAYEKASKGSRAVSPEIAAMQTQAKSLADQVYNTLESQYPNLRGLGKSEGAKIALKNSIEQAIPRIMNTELINLGLPAGVAMGEMLGGNAGALSMLAAKLVERFPAVKAGLAVAMFKGGKLAKKVPSGIPRYAYGSGQYLTEENK